MRRLILLLTVAAAGSAWPSAAVAQGYRVRVDTRLQSVAYRGLAVDSIPIADTVATAGGGVQTADGFAVRCQADGFCRYFRPDSALRGGPLVSSVDLSLWGLGIPGLRVRAKGRVSAELGDPDVWPGADPTLQLLEGYAEYSQRYLTVQAGRTFFLSRLGYTQLDGATVELRPVGRWARLMGYAGWGLQPGAPLPVTGSELNPLDEYRPSEREIVWGGGFNLSGRGAYLRGVYRRSVNTAGDFLVSERVAGDAQLSLGPGIALSGGGDYDLVRGLWGTGEAQLSYVAPRSSLQLTVGGRRYRPYFDLWTIWGAFSPVAYSSAYATGQVRVVRGISLRGRGELYDYDDAEALTPLVQTEDDGWRWSLGATVTRFTGWVFQFGHHVEHGPGAASLGWEGLVAFRPESSLGILAHGSWMKRPLEYRFDDAKVVSYGLRADYRYSSRLTAFAEARRYDELRRRDDAAQLDWDQLRLYLGATVAFGSGADTGGLHPAILRIPDSRR
ncbi:MAG: hypothetical protein ACE5PT_05180 [Gemmatimonadales bacterium]